MTWGAGHESPESTQSLPAALTGYAIVIVMQRHHEADLAGYLLESGEWTHLNIPAISEEEQRIIVGQGRTKIRAAGEVLDPVREPLWVLDQLREQLEPLAHDVPEARISYTRSSNADTRLSILSST